MSVCVILNVLSMDQKLSIKSILRFENYVYSQDNSKLDPKPLLLGSHGNSKTPSKKTIHLGLV